MSVYLSYVPFAELFFEIHYRYNANVLGVAEKINPELCQYSGFREGSGGYQIRTRESKKIYVDMIESLREGQDMIIVADLTRAGRDLINVIQNINRIVERNLAFVAIDNGINISFNTEKLDFATKALVYNFAMMGELQRDLISMNTKDKLQAAKKRGVKLGRPKGNTSKSKLDGKEQAITELLDKRVSKASIARIMAVSPTTIKHFIKSRKLEPGDLLKATR